MRTITLPAGLALAVLAVAAPAAAGAGSLPTVTRTLSADAAVARTCSQVPDAAARGIARAAYRAPMSGFVTARLEGPATSDWDLVAIDRTSGGRLATSSAFGSSEVAQHWVAAGQRVDYVGCRRRGDAESVTLRISFADVRPPTGAATASLLRVFGPAEKITALEDAGLDVTHNRRASYADVLIAGAAQREIVRRSGLRAITRVADMNAFAARSDAADRRYAARLAAAGAESPIPSGRTTYRTYTDIQNELKALVEKNPGLVRPVTIGKTVQGRDIQGVEIAQDVNADDGRPTYFLMGVHHAREWPSEEASMEYAIMLAKERSDPRIAALLAGERTTVVPVVNIDGFVSTRTAGQIDPNDNNPAGQNSTVHLVEAVTPPGGILAYRRKNCAGAVPSGNFPCELQWGVDNNRNYGNLWGGPGSSQDPTSQSFHGPAPRSEPETQAVWNYGRTHNVTLMMTLHNVAALVLRPPGLHDGGKAPDEARMKELGDAMGAATKYTSQYSFQLYDTAGTTDDDFYASLGPFSFTIEIGPANGMFHMPYEKGFIDQWVKGDGGPGGLREALLISAEAAMNPRDHAVLTGRSTPGAVLRVRKAFDTQTSPYCAIGVSPVAVGDAPGPLACPGGLQKPLTLKDSLDQRMVVPADGRYRWSLNPSTRPFVGGGAVIEKLSETSSRTDTFTGGGPDPVNNTPAASEQDRPFTILPEDNASAVRIDVTWGTPEDYDVEVYRKAADGSLTKVGSSGKAPGQPEQVVLTGDKAAPGNYLLRVVNYAAAVGTWKATIGRYALTSTTTTGRPESYVLTCEIEGRVVRSQDLTIGRGQVMEFDPCASPAPPANLSTGSSNATGRVDGEPSGAGATEGSSADETKVADAKGGRTTKGTRGAADRRARARIRFMGERFRSERWVRRHGLRARVTCPTRCVATATVKYGLVMVGRGRRAGTGTFVVRARLTPKGVRSLAEHGASRVRMIVAARDDRPRPRKRAGGFVIR